MTDELAQEKVVEIMRSDHFCMLTSIGVAQGRLHSHPMTPQEITAYGDVWFFIDTESDHADNLRRRARQPRLRQLLDLAGGRARHLAARRPRRSTSCGEFRSGGLVPQGQGLLSVGAGLLVEADSAEYWDSPGGRIASVLAYAKSKITKGCRTSAESDSMEL